MTALDRTKEFFADGGVLFSRNNGFLSKTVAGLGLAAIITVFPNDVGNSAISPQGAETTSFSNVPSLAERIKQHKSQNQRSNLEVKAEVTGAAIIASLPPMDPLPPPNLTSQSRYSLTDALGDAIDVLHFQAEQLSTNVKIHQFGDYDVPQFVAKELVRAANDTKFPVETLFAIAEKESSFDIMAQNENSTAAGPMQFLEQKWLEMVKNHGPNYGLEYEASLIEEKTKAKGVEYVVKNKKAEARILDLRFSPYHAGVFAAVNLLDAKKRIEERVQANISNDDLYLPHFLGTSGAGNLIEKAGEKPNVLASKVFPKAAKANRNMFKGKGGKQLTLRQFHEQARNVIRQRLGKYQNVEALVAEAAKPTRELDPSNAVLEAGYKFASAMKP